MRERQDPIVQSRLDTDWYTFTMDSFVWKHYRDVPVRYAFKNRTKGIDLSKHIDERQLREELNHAEKIQFTEQELWFVADQLKISPWSQYIRHLRELKKLPDYELRWNPDGFELEFPGGWGEGAMHWEEPALFIINQLYYESLMKKMSRFERECVYAEGRLRLAQKIRILGNYPELSFDEFGTRRRFNGPWQSEVVETLADELNNRGNNQLSGTSNVCLAMKLGLKPKGTRAHQLEMIAAAIARKNADNRRPNEIAEVMRISQLYVAEVWERENGPSLFLPDAFGSKQYFELIPPGMLERSPGSRQDSGDPDQYARMIQEIYDRHGIDSRKKILMPSDGQTLETMIPFFCKFRRMFNVQFGVGTYWTNDLGLKPISIVVKPIEAYGYGLVKLSDNLAKATGKPEDIAFYREVFGHTSTFHEECKY